MSSWVLACSISFRLWPLTWNRSHGTGCHCGRSGPTKVRCSLTIPFSTREGRQMARGRPRRYDANDFLIEVWRSHQRQHMPPTIQELADMFDPKPSTRTVLRYLRSLEAACFL